MSCRVGGWRSGFHTTEMPVSRAITNAVTGVRSLGKWSEHKVEVEVAKPTGLGSGVAVLFQHTNVAGGTEKIIGAEVL